MPRESCAKETCQDISQWFRLMFRNVRTIYHEVISQISCKLAPIHKLTFNSSRLQQNLLQRDPSIYITLPHKHFTPNVSHDRRTDVANTLGTALFLYRDRRFTTLQRMLFIYLINKYISLSDIYLTEHH